MGRIGKAMARRCFHALDMEVVFYDAYPVADAGVPARQLATVDEVLQASDFVSLHCPGGGENIHLINADRLARMKPTAFLINSARGDIVDEAALVAALQAGTIAGAGLGQRNHRDPRGDGHDRGREPDRLLRRQRAAKPGGVRRIFA
jgi:lactate dehydrogenase-like 2-hydroxyacid dehydrogenase